MFHTKVTDIFLGCPQVALNFILTLIFKVKSEFFVRIWPNVPSLWSFHNSKGAWYGIPFENLLTFYIKSLLFGSAFYEAFLFQNGYPACGIPFWKKKNVTMKWPWRSRTNSRSLFGSQGKSSLLFVTLFLPSANC